VVVDDARPFPSTSAALIAILGQTATGKSALALSLAERVGGEIISCDSTAVYRGFDIGTDKVPFDQRRNIVHHLVDVADPSDDYTAARYSTEAAAATRDVLARGRVPILVGGTGLYYRALVRGLFPAPGRCPPLRDRLAGIAERRGPRALHRMLERLDPAAARRIGSFDIKRMVRALEVRFLTGRPMTEQFAQTRSPLEGVRVHAVGLSLSGPEITDRVRRRVDQQFGRGLLDEIRGLLARGVPPTARPFGGLVYRQALEHLKGLRDEAATRDLIARENRRYARRQLIWFRKEPNLVWLRTPGERDETYDACVALLRDRGVLI